MRNVLLGMFIMLLLVGGFFLFVYYERSERELEYEKSASSSLEVDFSKRHSAIRETIIEGTVYNRAEQTTFDNIQLAIAFYDGNKNELKRYLLKLDDGIYPRKSLPFKFTQFAPIGTEDVKVWVYDADDL